MSRVHLENGKKEREGWPGLPKNLEFPVLQFPALPLPLHLPWTKLLTYPLVFIHSFTHTSEVLCDSHSHKKERDRGNLCLLTRPSRVRAV